MAKNNIKCRGCGKLFDYDKYYGICPKCGIYTSLKQTNNDFDDGRFRENREGDIYKQNNLNLDHSHDNNNEDIIYKQNNFDLNHSHSDFNSFNNNERNEFFDNNFYDENDYNDNSSNMTDRDKKFFYLIFFLFIFNPFVAIIAFIIYLVKRNDDNNRNE